MKEFEINQTAETIIIKKSKEENHSLEDLKQKTINKLYNSTFVDGNEVNLLKLLLENEKTR